MQPLESIEVGDKIKVDWCSSELTLRAKDDGVYTWHRIWEIDIPGVLVWDRKIYPDDRGSYQELSKLDPLAEVLGREITVKQLSLSRNKAKGVLRGLHAEPMDKIVTPIRGKVFIALADIRENSATFGKYVTFTIDATEVEGEDVNEPKTSIVVPEGLGNSFMTCGEQEVWYLYQTSAEYKTSEGKRSVHWKDPDLGIPWPMEPVIISEADRKNPTLRDLFPGRFDG